MDACCGRSADAGTGCDGVAVGADAVVARGIDAELDAEPSSWPVPPGEKTDPAGSQAPVTPTPPDAQGDVPAVVVGRLRVPGPLVTTRGAALTGIPGTRPARGGGHAQTVRRGMVTLAVMQAMLGYTCEAEWSVAREMSSVPNVSVPSQPIGLQPRGSGHRHPAGRYRRLAHPRGRPPDGSAAADPPRNTSGRWRCPAPSGRASPTGPRRVGGRRRVHAASGQHGAGQGQQG